MHILWVKKMHVLRPLLNDWNYFWNKYDNLPFLGIRCSQFPILIFRALSWYQKAEITLWTSLQNKKKSREKKTYWGKNDYGHYQIVRPTTTTHKQP